MSIYSDIIKDKSIKTFKEKLTKISDATTGQMSNLTKVLLNYEEKMSNDNVDEKVGSTLNMQLCKVLVSVLQTEDSSEFNDMFKLINLTFNNFRDSAYNEIKLHRFIDSWDDIRLLASYTILIGTITLLCDPNTRDENKKRISLDTTKKPYLIENSTLKPEELNKVVVFYDLKVDA